MKKHGGMPPYQPNVLLFIKRKMVINMIVFDKLNIQKNITKKVVCYFLAAIICFACGNLYHEYNLMQNESDKISCSINALRDEIILYLNMINPIGLELSFMLRKYISR